jgi:hypothetical protein
LQPFKGRRRATRTGFQLWMAAAPRRPQRWFSPVQPAAESPPVNRLRRAIALHACAWSACAGGRWSWLRLAAMAECVDQQRERGRALAADRPAGSAGLSGVPEVTGRPHDGRDRLVLGLGPVQVWRAPRDLAVTDRRLPYLADFYSLLDRMPIADLRRATVIAATGCCPRFGSHDAVGRLDDVVAYRIYRKAPCNV